MSRDRKVFGVSELNRMAKSVLEEELGHLWVEGEISNFTHAYSGHMYFSIKDEKAEIKAALFRGSQQGLKVEMRNGIKVQAYGQVTLYEARGSYQIICRQIEEAGKGSLQEAFEKLKAKLEAEGLFDPERKKPLPALPRRIGVVTSATGAAIRDILNVIDRRFPNMHIIIAATRVQGEGAAEEIAEGIRRLNRRGGIDVMIVGRGGGSLEDLWAFNEEVVARAVAESEVPVISAVGHEIDFTICDFVADKRAETPSAAAELIVGPREEFEARIRQHARNLKREVLHRLRAEQQLADEWSARLVRCAERLAESQRRRLQVQRNRLAALSPQTRLKHHAQRVERAKGNLTRLIDRAAQNERAGLEGLSDRSDRSVRSFLETRRHHLVRYAAQLAALNPGLVLQRGYSVTRTEEGAVVTSAEQVEAGGRIETLLAQGRLISHITDRTTGESHGRKKNR